MNLQVLPKEFVQALSVLEKIKSAGYEAYFVGGSVRDALLNRQIHDVDIASSAYPEEIKQIFPYTIDVGIEHGTILVLMGKEQSEQYEVTTFRTESTYTDYRRPDAVDFVRDLGEDLKRRDFTINAFAMDTDGTIIDRFDGLTDLKEKRIRAVGQATERFNEDALRIMRAMRFSASLDFDIEKQTLKAMKDKSHLLEKISIERSFIELDKLLMADSWKKGIKILLETEAYKYLPDLQADALEKLLSNITDDFIFQTSEQAWATLLIGYEKINVKSFLKKWKVSNDFMKTVSELVQAYHLSEWDLSALYRFGKANLELVEHLKVAQGKNIDSDLLDRLDEELQIHDKSEIVVSGNALIQELNIKAGPQLGQILKSIEENIVENKLNNDKDEIFDFVRSKFEYL